MKSPVVPAGSPTPLMGLAVEANTRARGLGHRINGMWTVQQQTAETACIDCRDRVRISVVPGELLLSGDAVSRECSNSQLKTRAVEAKA